MKSSKKNNKKKRKNGLWFSNSATAESFSVASGEKITSILENLIFYVITMPMQLIQTAGVFVIAYFNNAFAPLSFFLLGFFFTRTQLGETFHLNTTVTCTTVTWIFFFIITYFIPSVYISVFLCIVLGCSVSIYMNYMVTKDVYKCQEG